MMRLDRYGLMAGVGVPVLLVTLSMLARTELVIGDRVRAAVEARASRAGADVEILTVGPAGLWGIELERVSARVPRGDFAIEVDVESVVVTPTLSSLLFGDLVIDEVDVGRGIVAVVPWSAKPRPPAARPKSTSPPKKTASRAPRAPAPIEVTLNNLQVIALNDAYRSEPLDLTRLEFEWTRGKPVSRLAGYGHLPDGVAFSIGAKDGVYRLQPQERTHIDRWVAPVAGVGWPVSLQVRDIRLCPTCENVVALEDVEIGVPAWRDDVRITAPVADVSRRGAQVALSAPEMAIVDATTRDFSARITESAFRYALDTGYLDGRLELAAIDGGRLGWRWRWDAEDFTVDFEAHDFPLSSVWYLSGLEDRVRPGRINGEASLGWDMRHRSLGVSADLHLDRLTLRVPFTDEPIDLEDGRFELDAYFDARGRAASIQRAALTIGGAQPIEGALQVVDAGEGVAFDGDFRVTEQDVGQLVAALPAQWTEVVAGGELRGDFGFDIHAAGHSAYPESLVLSGELLGDVDVVREGTANVRKIGASGPPPMRRFDHWTSLSAIGKHVSDVVLAAEDAKFFSHDGFDWKGLERAMVHNLRVKRPDRGGSTISQQVAKNLFLDGGRTLARKLQEAYLTWRLESVVPKRRILEIYLNIAEWGNSIRGIGAASQHYFGVEPRRMEPVEVALLAAILPNPHRFGGWIDQGYIATSRLEKVEHVLRNLKFLNKLSADKYRALWAAAQRGELGRLRLTPCDDRGRDTAPRCPSRRDP